jgi:methylaspartate mutase epsilon subunit
VSEHALVAPTSPPLGPYVAAARRAGRLVVQPRMGFSDPATMRAGLAATKAVPGPTVGTITLDSYTRTRDYDGVRDSLRQGVPLNGYPIVSYPAQVTRTMLDGVCDAGFPVQVRHGSPDPRDVVAALVRTGLLSTEGGPVSYCLPYGRMPLGAALRAWEESCALLASRYADGGSPHLETFGGCLMGQLCPPSLLVAISLLEAMFFRGKGIESVSLSYAQQTHPGQDEEAILAIHTLAAEFLPGVDWHVVVYAYMGMYPRTARGARLLNEEAAKLAVRTGAARLIVKTTAEAHRIPTVDDNVAALRTAAQTAAATAGPAGSLVAQGTQVYVEARTLVDAVLDLDADVGRGLVTAFARGYLDVPFCLHPDNAGRAHSFVDASGRLAWSDVGRMPIAQVAEVRPARRMTSTELLAALTYVERRYDDQSPALTPLRRNGDSDDSY